MRTPKLALVIVLAAAAGLNCDDDGKSTGADGGGRGGSTGGTGGNVSTGGTGGTTATGGTGGTTATGGTGGTATGGTTGTGGTGGTATGGTGGTTATGGTGGTTATGGMGGAATGGTGGASANCDIPCLTSLVSNCAPAGACMSQTTLLPPSVNQCYANGVKVTTAIALGAGGSGSAVITYSKAGQTCYSVEAPVTAGAMTFMFTYKNAAGTVVATGTFDSATSKTTVTCAGSAMTYDLSSAACANVPRGQMPPMGGGDAGANQCPMGTCM
jgi:hypothetical protein